MHIKIQSCFEYVKLNQIQFCTHSDELKEIWLASRGWTRPTLGQESSEPISPQGVRVGTRV